MRLLLIDNHDSFSAMLSHYLWELTGRKPLFFRNDELSREELEMLDFDAAVLSPGPGHPANVRDFGVCRDLLELYPHKPVLGVCLGMQGMAHFAGGRVVPWDGALHGRPSDIAHDGTGLYRDVPPEFSAIRYHSLVVDPHSLPASIQITGRAVEDGQIMSMAFADRPWFGVQFHPESIGTAQGKKILSNFLDLAMPGRSHPEAIPSQNISIPPASASLSTLPYVELPWRDPAETFVRFFSAAPTAFWLDGAHARPQSGWPSTAMGCAEQRIDLIATADRSAKSLFPPASSAGRDVPWPGYRGGPIGQFDYEWNAMVAVREAASTSNASNASQAATVGRWMIPEGWLTFDHAAHRAFAAWEGGAPPAWLKAVIDGWDPVAATGITNLPEAALPPISGEAALPPISGEAALPPFAEWKPLLTEAEYVHCVTTLQEAIARGETYEACLTHAYSAVSDADPLGVFLRLRTRNPAPYAAYLAFPDVRILSASPELFLEASDAGVLRSRPIKGTRRRGVDAAGDRVLREDLLGSEKDAAENRMITDLTRNDLARVCLPGSIEVPAFLSIEEHPAVFQLVSEVRGGMSPGEDVWSALAACFPGGSMTGAPKERTMEILKSLEFAPRGIYSGALGYLTKGGAFLLSMVIRTLVTEGGVWKTGCGGAVLIDSDAEAEWREATVKARSVIDAAGS